MVRFIVIFARDRRQGVRSDSLGNTDFSAGLCGESHSSSVLRVAWPVVLSQNLGSATATEHLGNLFYTADMIGVPSGGFRRGIGYRLRADHPTGLHRLFRAIQGYSAIKSLYCSTA